MKRLFFISMFMLGLVGLRAQTNNNWFPVQIYWNTTNLSDPFNGKVMFPTNMGTANTFGGGSGNTNALNASQSNVVASAIINSSGTNITVPPDTAATLHQSNVVSTAANNIFPGTNTFTGVITSNLQIGGLTINVPTNTILLSGNSDTNLGFFLPVSATLLTNSLQQSFVLYNAGLWYVMDSFGRTHYSRGTNFVGTWNIGAYGIGPAPVSALVPVINGAVVIGGNSNVLFNGISGVNAKLSGLFSGQATIFNTPPSLGAGSVPYIGSGGLVFGATTGAGQVTVGTPFTGGGLMATNSGGNLLFHFKGTTGDLFIPGNLILGSTDGLNGTRAGNAMFADTNTLLIAGTGGQYDAGGLTNLQSTNLVGTVPMSNLPSVVITNGRPGVAVITVSNASTAGMASTAGTATNAPDGSALVSSNYLTTNLWTASAYAAYLRTNGVVAQANAVNPTNFAAQLAVGTVSNASTAGTATNVANYVVWKRMGAVTVSGAEANVVFETNSTMLTAPAYALDGPPHVFKMWVDRAGLVEYYESYDGITFTNYSLNPVATNGFSYSLFSNGGTNYMFANDQGQNYENLYWVSNNVHFVLLRTNVLFTGSGSLGNFAVSTNANGYFMLYEDIEAEGSWDIYEAFSATLTNWVVPTAASGTAIPVIAQPGGTMGGPWIRVVGGVYYCWCHGTETNGLNLRLNGSYSVLPTCLYRWHSLDSTNWVCDGQTLLRDTYDEGATDLSGQLADPCLVEVTNQCYLYYSAGGSAAPTILSAPSHIKVAKANMPLSALVKTSETGDHSEIAQNNLNIRRINNDVSVGERLPLNWSSGINSGLAVVNQLYIPCDDSPANFPPQWGGIPGLFIFGTNAVSSIVLGYGNTHLYNNIIVGGDIEYRIVSSNLMSFANYLTISGDSSSISAVVLGNTGTATTLMGTVYGNGSGLTNLQTTNFVGTLPLHNYFTSLSVPNTNGIGITNLTFPHGLTSAPTIFGAYVSCVHNDASSGITTNTTKIPSGNFWVVVSGNMKEQAFGVAADNTNIIVNMTSFSAANYITVLWNGVWVGITNPTNFVLNPYYSNF